MLYNKKKKTESFFLGVLVLSLMKRIKVGVEGLSQLIDHCSLPPVKLTLTVTWLVAPLAQCGTQIDLRSLQCLWDI